MTKSMCLQNTGDFPRIIPGAIFDYQGKVQLINEYVTVDIKFQDLIFIPSQLTEISRDIESVKIRLHDLEKLYNTKNKLLMNQIFKTLEYAENTLDTAFTWFPNNQNTRNQDFRNKRTKRGLINAIGSGFKYLFGVATEDEISDIRDRITTIQDVRRQNDMLLENLHSASRQQAIKINEIISQSTQLVQQGLNLSLDVHTIERLTFLSHLAININMNLQHTITNLKSTVDCIVLATTGIVTTNLVSFSELQHIINKSISVYDVKPLFDTHDLFLYYSYLKVQVAPYHIFVHIPMSTNQLFHHFSILPFPTFHYNVSVQLDAIDSHVFVADDLSFYTELTNEDIDMCNLHGRKRICESYHFPLKRFVQSCVTDLVKRHMTDELEPQCSYSEVPNMYHIRTIHDKIFLHNPGRLPINIKCNGTKISRLPNIQVPHTCSLESKLFVLRGLTLKNIQYKKLKAPQWKQVTDVNWTRPKNITLLKPLKLSNNTYINNSVTHVMLSSFSVFLSVIACIFFVSLIVYHKMKCTKNQRSHDHTSHNSDELHDLQHVAI